MTKLSIIYRDFYIENKTKKIVKVYIGQISIATSPDWTVYASAIFPSGKIDFQTENNITSDLQTIKGELN